MTSWFVLADSNVLFLIPTACLKRQNHAHPRRTRWPRGSNYSALKNNVIAGRNSAQAAGEPSVCLHKSQVAICVGLSLQSVLATRLLGGFLSNDESSSPMKETAVHCLELKLHCLPVSAKRQA